MTVPLWAWLATFGGLGVLVAFDALEARKPQQGGLRQPAIWTAIYVAAAAGFGTALHIWAGEDAGTSFFAGYLVERTLSVDNLFVFAVVLQQFAVPACHRQRVLLIGVLGALVVRGGLIVAGATMIERFTFTFAAFGALLIYSAVHLLRSHGNPPDLANMRAVRMLRRTMPITSDYQDGALIVHRAGRRAATPLLVAVMTILSVDVVFALDSIPAIFGITDSSYLVFTANAFALLGLRPLYFLIVGLLDRLVHLAYGLAIVLGFIGARLILHYAHTVNHAVPQISTGVSLVVVVATLTITILTSLNSRRPSSRPEPGLRPSDARFESEHAA